MSTVTLTIFGFFVAVALIVAYVVNGVFI